MKWSKGSPRPAKTWPTILLILLISSTNPLWTGYASAETIETVKAQLDSTRTAFFFLKYDYEVLEATSSGKAKTDSLYLGQVITFYEKSLDDERSKRHRDLAVIGLTAVVTGLLFYLGSRTD